MTTLSNTELLSSILTATNDLSSLVTTVAIGAKPHRSSRHNVVALIDFIDSLDLQANPQKKQILQLRDLAQHWIFTPTTPVSTKLIIGPRATAAPSIFTKLPSDILKLICTHLDPESFCAFTETCYAAWIRQPMLVSAEQDKATRYLNHLFRKGDQAMIDNFFQTCATTCSMDLQVQHSTELTNKIIDKFTIRLLQLTEKNLSQAEIKLFLEKCPKLQHLVIQACDTLQKTALNQSEYPASLRTFSLILNKPKKIDLAKVLQNLFTRCAALKMLHVTQPTQSASRVARLHSHALQTLQFVNLQTVKFFRLQFELNILFGQLASITSLTSLQFAFCTLLNPQNAAIRPLCSVSSLTLLGNSGDECVEALYQSLPNWPAVKQLTIDSEQVDVDVPITFPQTIESLRLCSSFVSDDFYLSTVFDSLTEQCPQVKSVAILYNWNEEENKMDGAFAEMSVPATIEELDLTQTNTSLVEHLDKFTRLKQLKMVLDAETTPALPTTIEELHLTIYGEASFSRLSTLLTGCPSLESLSLLYLKKNDDIWRDTPMPIDFFPELQQVLSAIKKTHPTLKWHLDVVDLPDESEPERYFPLLTMTSDHPSVMFPLDKGNITWFYPVHNYLGIN